MNQTDPTSHPHDPRANGPGGGPRWVFWGFVAVAAFFLLSEHRAHVLGFLPYLLLLACPLMHLFHHHGHGGHRNRSDDEKGRPQ